VGARRAGESHPLEPGQSRWPDAPIKLFGPGADSGTFDYFTEAVVGKSKSSRGDFTASEDDNVLVQGVSRDVNGLGYFGYAYYIENKDKLKAVPIVNEKGQPVEPSMEAVLKGTYSPLARPIFIYVNAKALAKPEVKEFVEYYMKHGAKLARRSEVRAVARLGLYGRDGAYPEGQEGHGIRWPCGGGRHHRRAAEARSEAVSR